MKWQLAPDSYYYVKKVDIAVQDGVDRSKYDTWYIGKDNENLCDWMKKGNLMDRVWVDVSLGSVRCECLRLYEHLIGFHPECIFMVHWESFESLWPIYDWGKCASFRNAHEDDA